MAILDVGYMLELNEAPPTAWELIFLDIRIKMIGIQAFFLFLILCSLSISIIFEYIFYQKNSNSD